jgi:hypothetical protein
MAIPSSTIYYNFSAECVNSNYIGVSGAQANISLSPNSIGNSFYFSQVTNCVTNCNGVPSEISGCFKFISSGTTPSYAVYTSFSLNPLSDIYPTTSECLGSHPCPVEQEYVYFKYCCPQDGGAGNDYFAILTNTGIFQLGSTYFITIASTSACTTVVSSIGVPSGVVTYQNIPYTYEIYTSCSSCTGSTGGCNVKPTPTPTIYYSSDTRCGNNILKRNECDPIVIFPMGVQCTGTNPTLTTIPDGNLSLIITGGTPPYSITWSTGGNGLYLTNLGVGTYNATVIDFYGDFTAYTQCTLTAPTPVPTETRLTNTPTVTPTITPTPDTNYPSFCLTMSVGTPTQTIQQYFTYYGIIINSMPLYVGGDYNINWSTTIVPNGWVINGPTVGGKIENYNISIPPIDDWVFTNTQILDGNVTGVLGDCPTYGNLCFTYRQVKGSNSPTYEGIIDLFYVGMVNNYPSWESSDGTYILFWDTSTVTSGRWVIDFTTNPSYVDPVNPNPTIPPLSGWQQPGTTPPSIAIIYEGNCTPSTTVNVNLGEGGSSSGGELDGTTITNNPSAGNVPFTDAPVDNLERLEAESIQCECLAVRTFNQRTVFYTACDGTLQQVITPGGVWTDPNARRCICRRVGTSVYSEPSGSVIEEPCQTESQGIVTNSSGSFINDCLNIIGDTCVSNVTGSSTRSATTTVENNGIINNGNITLRASGGFPPYEYSIDGGLTYKYTPLFSKLGAGTYSTVIKDSSGNTYTQSVVLVAPARPTIYQVSLQTTSSTPRSGQNTTTRQFTSTISVTPSLPNGVVILFDLIHTSNFKSSPATTAATFSTNTLLKKNSINYSSNTVVSETGTTLNTNSGCQQKLIYTTGRTETWTSVSYTNRDTLSLNTSTTITKNSIDKCYVGDAIDDFILTNLTISGCTNCGVSNISV